MIFDKNMSISLFQNRKYAVFIEKRLTFMQFGGKIYNVTKDLRTDRVPIPEGEKD